MTMRRFLLLKSQFERTTKSVGRRSGENRCKQPKAPRAHSTTTRSRASAMLRNSPAAAGGGAVPSWFYARSGAARNAAATAAAAAACTAIYSVITFPSLRDKWPRSKDVPTDHDRGIVKMIF